jgi:hypothetical protein
LAAVTIAINLSLRLPDLIINRFNGTNDLITSINGDIRSTKDEIESLKEAVDREVRKPALLSFGEEIRIMHQNGTLNEDSL